MACYTFTVGAIRCVVIPDLTAVSSPADITARFPPDCQDAILALNPDPETAMDCLLVESDGQVILFDTGLGKLNPAHSPQLIPHLQEAGVTPQDVDIVVITHGHGDHIGGIVDEAGELVFANARHIMTRLDWDHWTGPALNPSAERCLLPLRDRITLIEPDDLIAPGVRALPAPGHTPGHIGAVIESQGEKCMHLVDALHHTFQVAHPEWSPKFDTDPVLAADTRRALLAQAAAEDCRVMLYHFGWPGLGSIQAEGDSFVFTREV